jgi:hypothetical protein
VHLQYIRVVGESQEKARRKPRDESPFTAAGLASALIWYDKAVSNIKAELATKKKNKVEVATVEGDKVKVAQAEQDKAQMATVVMRGSPS